METIQQFDPGIYSEDENKFLLAHIGEPTIVALRQLAPPVNPRAVRPILERVNELLDLEKHEGASWAGVGAIKTSIEVWLRENAKWERDNARNPKAPRYPSMYSFDARGRAHKGGIGSDSNRPRTYFGPAGERIPFAVELLPDNVAPWTAPGFTEQSAEVTLFIDSTLNRIECRVPQADGSVCGHTESYKAESRASYSAARARMSKHLRKATNNEEGHRELHTNEFGS